VRPERLGHKALAVNLSDLAACGAKPVAFTLALALEPSTALPALRPGTGCRAGRRKYLSINSNSPTRSRLHVARER
jgi:phosphoribosylaminoimidazole (AIR) synthetase